MVDIEVPMCTQMVFGDPPILERVRRIDGRQRGGAAEVLATRSPRALQRGEIGNRLAHIRLDDLGN